MTKLARRTAQVDIFSGDCLPLPGQDVFAYYGPDDGWAEASYAGRWRNADNIPGAPICWFIPPEIPTQWFGEKESA
jgi:hypothetical protein